MVNIIEESKAALDKAKEIIPSNNNHGFLSKILRSKDDESSVQQLAVGGASGWVTGFAFTKFGKVVCFGVGISLLGIYLGHRSGYLKVDMKRVEKDAASVKKEMEKIAKKAEKELPGFIDKAGKYVSDNALLVLGFSAGYLLGVASA
ncbi:FUN14 domain-containing protein 1 [Tetranychus urticae]|uniref:FUN14 domain-containing protein 1 n=1 Tax=Tetranychus urticae TaxID=32264 RepID=T1KAM4_TETUR|nr:FUN14 domain-containing protein 1 [Tetranychus urticae]